MDFVISLPISTDWKRDSYNFILVIMERLIKMMHYKPVQVTINVANLAEMIIDVVVQYHDFSDSIVSDRRIIFIFKFWSLLIAFHSHINGQTEK